MELTPVVLAAFSPSGAVFLQEVTVKLNLEE